MRGRGLKYSRRAIKVSVIVSLPMRGRGLKFAQSIQQTAGNAVAPHAGAWIEI